MKTYQFFLIILLFGSCIQHTESNEQQVDVKNQINVEVKYAKGFSVDNSNSEFTKITINSIESTFDFTDSIFIPHTVDFKPNGRKIVRNEYESLALQSSTYLPFLNVLQQVDLVKGISGLDYVTSPEYSQILEKNRVKEISIGGSIQMESLLDVNPDLFLIFPFELDNKEKYEEKGIQTLLISEYLEESTLARLEWVKLFGLLLGEYELAESYFSEIEKNYFVRTTVVDSSKTMFFNLPFKDNWNMPSSNSITANLAKDAGFNYIYADTINDNSVRPKEQVWNDAMNCDYWIIIASRPADFTLADLITEEEIYASFPAVKNGKVLFCNTLTSNYFTDGIIEPDKMLDDLIYGSQSINGYTPKFFKILK